MSSDANKTVRELALETPEASRVFEELKIDYCCGGARTLEAACADAGVEVEEVLSLLKRMAAFPGENSDAIDFQTLTPTELIYHILDKHHTFTRSEMERISALVERVCAAHGDRHAELTRVRALFRELCDDLRPHMLREEQVLFPYILRLEESVRGKLPPPFAPFGTVCNPVRLMTLEHDTAGELLREIRAASSDYAVPDDACASYLALYQSLRDFERDLHQHIHLENNILFPRAVEMESAARTT